MSKTNGIFNPPVDMPKTDVAIDMKEKISRGELFEWLNMFAPLTSLLAVPPPALAEKLGMDEIRRVQVADLQLMRQKIDLVMHHAVAIDLIRLKLGITDEEYDAHYKLLAEKQKADQAAAQAAAAEPHGSEGTIQ